MDPAYGEKKNLMIAEDDDEDFFIFSLAVEETQIAVALTRAENGEVLMKILSESIPDILFLDLQLPCKSGRQCIREIRADRRFDGLPIIIYSSFDDSESVDYCFRESANLFMVKPHNMTEFVDALKRILTINWKRANYFPGRPEFLISSTRRDV